LIEVASGFLAWLGAALIVLADGRRGLAAGIAVTTVGIAALVLQAAGPLDAAIVAAGGAVAIIPGLRNGEEWGLMPAGSTPRLILCIAAGLLALWLAASITTGTGAALRFAVIAVAGLSGTRIISTDSSPVLLTAVGALAFAVAAAAGLEGASAPPWPYAAAAVIVAGSAWLRPRTASAA
jgi:hypothetical protein